MATGTITAPIIKEKLMTNVQVSAGDKTLLKSLDDYDFLYLQVSSSSNGSTYGNEMPFIYKLPLEGSGSFFVNYFVSPSMLIQFNFGKVSSNKLGIYWADIQGYQKGRINAWGIRFG